MDTKKLDAEIEELENALTKGTTEDVEETEGPSEAPDLETTEATTDGATETAESDKAPTPETKEEPEDINWMTRYKSLRASTDAYKYQTRQELASLRESNQLLKQANQDLQSKIVVPKVDPFAETFTQEDRDNVGEEAIALMQKAAQAAADAKVAPILEQERLRQAREADANTNAIRNDRIEMQQLFENKLETLVPNYKEINYDPNFETFIKEADPVNGGSRLQHFKAAEASGNVAVVANYMKEFQPVDKLAAKVNPEGTGSKTVVKSNKKVMIPHKEVIKFYDDVSKGLYKGKDKIATKLEAKYDKAFAENRIAA